MSLRERHRQRGLTLIELSLVLLLTGIIFGVTQSLLSSTVENWWKVNANADAEQQLYKAQHFLERDIASAAYERENGRETVRVQKLAPASSLAGADGDVFWFLSAVDPNTGNLVRKPNGEPFWQRNIVYFCVTPQNLGQFGFSGSGLDVGGYESACPYKVLLRYEIDSNAPTSADPLTSEEEPLMTFDQLLPLLGRPDGYDTSGLAAPNIAVRPISGNIVTFRADYQDSISGVKFDIRASAVNRARREGGFGSIDLANHGATQQLELNLFPPNRQGSSRTDGT